MKDTPILLGTLLLMIVLMLGGQFLRGDYTRETARPAAISSAGQNMAVEQDGRALINLNAADAETLQRIDGIGEVLSGRIVSYREENGPFLSIEELLHVDGIGTATLEKLRPYLICIPE